MTKSGLSYSGGKFLLLYLLWWTFWSLLQTFVLHRFQLTWSLALADAFISNFLLALACLSAVMLYRYYQPGGSNRFYRFVYAIFITFLVGNAIKWLLQYYYKSNTEYVEFVEQSMPVRFVFSLMMLSFVTILNWLWNSIEEKSKQALKQTEVEQLLKETELVKLRQQLQPHFLFNSLNSISALAGSNPKEARKMIQQLSDFLRGTLKKDEEKTVYLKEEIEHLNLYLAIEKVRFGKRLSVLLKLNEEDLNAKTPPLLLQPIVENAIKFGLYGTIEDIEIVIDVQLTEGFLQVKISNPYDENFQPESKGTGFGLASVQRRLFLIYSRNDLLSVEKKGGIFTTKLIIPQIA